MIQVETSLINQQCEAWKDRLRNFRTALGNDLRSLQQAAAGRLLTHDQLLQVERLHNQVHIQQINIHDLKHEVKAHQKKTGYETNVNNGHLKDDTMAQHDGLDARYNSLIGTLDQLRTNFSRFLSQLSFQS